MARGKKKRVNSNKKSSKKNAPKKVVERRNANREKFLQKLEETPIVQVAAAQVGIHRSTFYRWRDDDPDYKEQAKKAMESGEGFVNDMMESLLIKLAKEGKVTPIIFWLKNHHPQYMEIRRYEHFHKHEFEKEVLTEERKKQIAEVMKLWFETDENEDEQEEDYGNDYEPPPDKKK